MHVYRVSVMPANAVTQVTAHAGEDVEKGEQSSIVGGSTNCTVTLEINMVVSQKKLGINIPQDPAIPLLGICPKNTLPHHLDTCTTMFTIALFVIARS